MTELSLAHFVLLDDPLRYAVALTAVAGRSGVWYDATGAKDLRQVGERSNHLATILRR